MAVPIPGPFRKKLTTARLARLATIDGRSPHLIPVCYAFDGKKIYTAIDRKPKKNTAKDLQRVRNIRSHPQVALIVDEYREDWNRLWYILLRGTAALVAASSTEHEHALRLLRRKYPQYRTGLLPADALVIRMTPERVICWGNP